MILLDSNIVIYLRDPILGEKIVGLLQNQRLDTCNIVVAEVLGFNGLENKDARYFVDLFDSMKNHLFNEEVTQKVIDIRRNTSLQLPDAIIAATAIVNKLTLWTHNTEDFKAVRDLKPFDPLFDS